MSLHRNYYDHYQTTTPLLSPHHSSIDDLDYSVLLFDDIFGGSVNNATKNGTSLLDKIRDGGIDITFYINIILAFVLVCGYVLVLQPFVGMYNRRYKSRLLRKILNRKKKVFVKGEGDNHDDGDDEDEDTNNDEDDENDNDENGDENGDENDDDDNGEMVTRRRREVSNGGGHGDGGNDMMQMEQNTTITSSSPSSPQSNNEKPQQNSDSSLSQIQIDITTTANAKETTGKAAPVQVTESAPRRAWRTLVRGVKRFAWFWIRRILFVWNTFLSLTIPWIRRRNRVELTTKYGRDLATFVFFQQMLIFALGLCSLIGLASLLPVHFTGTLPKDTDQSQNTFLVRTSVNMRLSEPLILYLHVGLAMLFILIFFLFGIVRFLCHPLVSRINYESADDEKLCSTDFEEKYLVKMTDWNTVRPLWARMTMLGMSVARSKEELDSNEHSVFLASPFCVSIHGIPPLMNQQAYLDVVHSAARAVPVDNLDQHILKAVLIPDLRKRIALENKLTQLKEKLEQVLFEKKRSKSTSPATVLSCCTKDVIDGGEFHVRKYYDAVEYYQKHIGYLEKDIANWDTLYLQTYTVQNEKYGQSDIVSAQNLFYQSSVKKTKIKPPQSSGVGFIVFDTVDAANTFCKYYRFRRLQLEQKELGKTVSVSKGLSLLKPITNKVKRKKQQQDSDSSIGTPIDIPLADMRPDGTVSDDVNNQSNSATPVDPQPIKRKRIQFSVVQKGKSTAGFIVRLLDYFSFFSLRISNLNYEPEDMELNNIFGYRDGGFSYFIRRVLLHIFLIIIFVVFCAPLALASGVQTLLSLEFVTISTAWLLKLTGPVGNLVFQYIPSLVVLIATSIMPSIIYYTAIYSKHDTHGSVQRKIVQRSYIYLILSTLLVPSILLTSFDGIIKYFSGNEIWEEAFKNLYLPASGSFFINVLLQKGLFNNAFYLYRLPNLLFYILDMRFTQRFWRVFPRVARYMSDVDKLKAAEQTSIYLEYEYAYMHWVVSITLAYSLFSPIVLPCGLLYFVFKYFVDRATIYDTYGHRKDVSFNGATLGFKNDFLNHQRMCILNVRILIGNCFVFAAFQCFFYAAKIVGDRRFIPHTAIMACLAFILLLCIPLISIVFWLHQKWNVKNNNYKVKEKNHTPIGVSTVTKWYEPSTPYDYLPLTTQLRGQPRSPMDRSEHGI